MGAFYGTKVISKEINEKTGKPWTIEDVPSLWKKKTQEWISANKKS